MAKAIELNPRNRIQARTDTDSNNMIEILVHGTLISWRCSKAEIP